MFPSGEGRIYAAFFSFSAFQFGDDAALVSAIKIYRVVLQGWPHKLVPFYWAMTQNDLGITLTTIGTLESGTTSLETAVEVYGIHP